MSGTSLDGIDLCLAEFWHKDQQWRYKIVCSETEKYDTKWKKELASSMELNGNDLALLDRNLGELFGKTAKTFIEKNKQKADLLASHGHTVFHQPEKQLSLQIGHGAFIAAQSGLTTVCDFRSMDTALGGQGAPLVPYAEKELLSEFDCFLNIGGIANLSIHQKNGITLGYDIAPANQVLNYISQQFFKKEYDEDGKLAESGKVNTSLLEELNGLEFYTKSGPKSLGREFTDSQVLPMLRRYSIPGEDLLCTYTHHLALQIELSIPKDVKDKKVLLSGGGAFNDFLMAELRDRGLNLCILEEQFTEMKEALCFGFLGLLRYLGRQNV
jgi:anhydro-N-acetylmuramic acid kinase